MQRAEPVGGLGGMQGHCQHSPCWSEGQARNWPMWVQCSGYIERGTDAASAGCSGAALSHSACRGTWREMI